METSGWGEVFQAWVSSEEVARGKPAPDVFLEAAAPDRRRSAPTPPGSRTPTTGSSPRAPRVCA